MPTSGSNPLTPEIMKHNLVVTVRTEQEYKALMKWAEGKSYMSESGKKPTAWDMYKEYGSNSAVVFKSYSKINFAMATGGVVDNNPKEYGPKVSFAVFAAIQGIELGPEPLEIKLGDYTAVVDYATSTVKVGCQTISFSKVQEVAAATKQQKADAIVSLTSYEEIGQLLVSFGKELRESGQPDNRYEIAKVLVKHGYKLVKK